MDKPRGLSRAKGAQCLLRTHRSLLSRWFSPVRRGPIALEDYLAKKRWAYGLNQYCDPIGTVYRGGTPLFDEATGLRLSRAEYLANRGLNLYCDAQETVYIGGSPLFDPSTGRRIPLSRYLAGKFRIL
jgi:hypothetical protein